MIILTIGWYEYRRTQYLHEAEEFNQFKLSDSNWEYLAKILSILIVDFEILLFHCFMIIETYK
jgi:hypothetical protein